MCMRDRKHAVMSEPMLRFVLLRPYAAGKMKKKGDTGR